MTDALTELPPGAVLAETWDECADHLESHGEHGGRVVWWNGTEWRPTTWGPIEYRSLSGHPDDGDWCPHALLPPVWRESTDPDELAAAVAVEVWDKHQQGWIAVTAPNTNFDLGVNRIGLRFRLPVSWKPEATGAERYLAERLAALPDVPDGHELVVLPRDAVDWYAENEIPDPDLTSACRAAVARRPKPEPETERVRAMEAVEDRRMVPHPAGPFEAEAIMWIEGEMAVCWYGGPAKPIAPDGTVEVLKDGDR